MQRALRRDVQRRCGVAQRRGFAAVPGVVAAGDVEPPAGAGAVHGPAPVHQHELVPCRFDQDVRRKHGAMHHAARVRETQD